MAYSPNDPDPESSPSASGDDAVFVPPELPAMNPKKSPNEQVLATIRERQYQLDFQRDVPESLKADRAVVLAALEHARSGFAIVPAALHADREVMLACAKHGLDLGSLPDAWKDDAEFVVELLRDSGSHFQHASPRVRGLRDVALLAVTDTSCNNLEHVPPPVCRDRQLLLTALRGHLQAYLHVPEDLRADPELLALALEHSEGNSLVFGAMPPSARDDREIALRMVSRDGWGFRHASERLRDDKEVLLAALAKDIRVLDDASARLKADADVARFVASSRDCRAGFRHLDPAVRNAPDIVALALQNGASLGDLSERWRDDEATVRIAVGCRGENYQAASDRLKAMRDIALLAARDHVRFSSQYQSTDFDLSWVPEPLRADPEIIGSAIRSNAYNISRVSPEVLGDDAFLRALVKLNDGVVQHLPESFKRRLLMTSVMSVEHRGRRIVYRMLLDDGRVVEDQQRTVREATVMAAGRPLVAMARMPVLTFEEDGPVGSYLSVRYRNNFVLAGDFVFFVMVNSGRHTFTNSLADGRWNGYGPEPKPIDDFLKHHVYLVPETVLTLGFDRLRACPRIHFGRDAFLPAGIQLFPTDASYSEAVTVLRQRVAHGEALFTRIDDATLQAAAIAVEEVAGAARVYVDGHGWRFLIPHADGAMRSLEVLGTTRNEDDWLWIRSHAGVLSDFQKQMLLTHFETASWAEEVRAFCR